MGWQDDPVVSQQGSWKDDPVVGAPQAAAPPADVGRQVALGGRAVGEGVVGALSSVAENTPFAIITRMLTGKTPSQLGEAGINALLHTNIHAPGSASEALSGFLNRFGAPTPQTPGEQLSSAVIRGTSGALALGGAAGGASAPNLVRAGISGATGAGASELARQQGAGPVGQFAAGLAGGLTPMAVEEGVRAAGRVASNVLAPLTQGGQQRIAANVMTTQATNPQAAAANLESAAPIVPGSARNAGEASQDVGLMALEKGLRSRNPADFGQRISEQNVARQAELSKVAGTPSDIEAAQTAREATTTPMREGALNSGGTANVRPVIQTIDRMLESPAGKRDIPSQALNWLREKLTAADDTSGRFMTPSQIAKAQRGTFEARDPANLYAIRQDINDAIAGRLGGEESKFRLAQSQLLNVRSALDNEIEAAAPGFKAYLQRYAELSKPIDQMKVIQEIQRRAQLTSADVTTGQNFIGNANFSRALDAAIQKSGQKLTQDQVDRLNAIRTDLQYGQSINSPLIKAPGSDTFQNLSIAQAIGMGGNAAHPIARLLTKPLAWIYKFSGSDEAINEILTRAMLDPKLSADMLKRATSGSMAAFSDRLRAATLGTTAATGVSTQPATAPGTAAQNRR